MAAFTRQKTDACFLAEWIIHRIGQHNRDTSGLQCSGTFNPQIDRARCFGLNPVAQATECAISCDDGTDAGDQCVETGITITALRLQC